MPDDPLKASLAEIRDLIGARDALVDRMRAGGTVGIREFNAAQDRLAGRVPGLLASVEAAAGRHQPVPLYGKASTGEEPDACPHNPDRDWDRHFESDDGEWLCELKPEGTVCSGCPGLPDGERIPWPCDEYEAILAALTGKEESGG